MPALFVGHGSPMNAIADNDYTRALALMGERLPRPKTILCISAHWLTDSMQITAMERPKTIHDFFGFPQALMEIQYPAPGSPRLAEQIAVDSRGTIQLDPQDWGLDHGAWAVLRHMYPAADIPVLQLSIEVKKPGPHHVRVGESLRALRDQGVLILGSGNIVHNLRQIVWQEDAPAFPWAVEFDQWSKERLLSRDVTALSEDYMATQAGRLSVPTPEHYYPLLYVLGASHTEDQVSFPFEGMQNGSMSMRCVCFG